MAAYTSLHTSRDAGDRGVTGCVPAGLAVAQVLLGAAHPRLASPQRKGWLSAHRVVGCITLVSGYASLALGIVVMHELRVSSDRAPPPRLQFVWPDQHV